VEVETKDVEDRGLAFGDVIEEDRSSVDGEVVVIFELSFAAAGEHSSLELLNLENKPILDDIMFEL
jgi:hypothetical protein